MNAPMVNSEVGLSGKEKPIVIAGLVGGALALGIAGLTSDWHHFMRSYLTAIAYVLSLSLGALFFVMLQHLTRAGWSVVVRRLA